ncbi:hypothetical protein HID58_041037 [Brassica napus]|uniref:Uncharacterized protein n=1 Tax=Brassica napus TaxID=3708 RepID=A0ABQ8B9Q3_BRANA|nr:hypothetical protein HID58_041037 [Brassica napus]
MSLTCEITTKTNLIIFFSAAIVQSSWICSGSRCRNVTGFTTPTLFRRSSFRIQTSPVFVHRHAVESHFSSLTQPVFASLAQPLVSSLTQPLFWILSLLLPLQRSIYLLCFFLISGILILNSTLAPAAASIGWNLSILIILIALATLPNSSAKVLFTPDSLSSSFAKFFFGPKTLPGVAANAGLLTEFCCGLSLFSGIFPTPRNFRCSSSKAFTLSSMVFWSINGLLRSNSVPTMVVRVALFSNSKSLLPSFSLKPFPAAAASDSFCWVAQLLTKLHPSFSSSSHSPSPAHYPAYSPALPRNLSQIYLHFQFYVPSTPMHRFAFYF